MFGEDAVISAKVLQIALTSRDKKREDSIPMCGVPYRAYEAYLNKLTAAGYKVAICEQMEDPAQAKGLVERQIVRVVTPGTTVSPQLIEADRNHYLLAINGTMRSKTLGIAFTDVSTGEFEVCEFRFDELTRFRDRRDVPCHSFRRGSVKVPGGYSEMQPGPLQYHPQASF